MLTVKTWDLLPAILYTQAVLNAVHETCQSIEQEDGSILNLKPSEITNKLVKHGLSPQAASQCVDLFDATEWSGTGLPLHQWLRRIRKFYYRLLIDANKLEFRE